MNNFIRKPLLFGSVVIFGVLILLVVLVLPAKKISPNIIQPVPNTFSSAISYGKDTLLISNDRSFATYNYQNGESKLFSPDNTSSDLSQTDSLELSTDNRYITFHNKIASAGGALDKVLTGANANTNLPYWWVYDTKSQTFHFFDASVTAVHVMNGQAYALTNADSQTNQSTIRVFSLPDFNEKPSIKIPASDNFRVCSSEFILHGVNNSLLITKDGINNQVIYDSARLINTYGETVIANVDSSDKKSQTLMEYNLVSSKSKAIKRGHIINIFANTPGGLAFSTQSGSFSMQSSTFIYGAADKSIHTLVLNTKKFGADFSPIGVLDDSTLVLKGSGLTYLAGSNIKEIKTSGTKSSEPVQFGSNTIELNYYSDEHAYIVTLDQESADQEKSAVYKQLISEGLDPNILDIRFSVFQPPTSFAL